MDIFFYIFGSAMLVGISISLGTMAASARSIAEALQTIEKKLDLMVPQSQGTEKTQPETHP